MPGRWNCHSFGNTFYILIFCLKWTVPRFCKGTALNWMHTASAIVPVPDEIKHVPVGNKQNLTVKCIRVFVQAFSNHVILCWANLCSTVQVQKAVNVIGVWIRENLEQLRTVCDFTEILKTVNFENFDPVTTNLEFGFKKSWVIFRLILANIKTSI